MLEVGMPWEMLSSSQGWEPWGPVHFVPPTVYWQLPIGLAHPPAPCLPSGRSSSLAPQFLCSTTMLAVTMALTWHRWAGGDMPWVWGM